MGALYVGLAYLLGSIPCSWLIGRLLYHVDLRREGNGNPGGGNLLALCGVAPGMAGIILDALKGTGAILLGRLLDQGDGMVMLGGAVAVAGHIWPAWLGFDGGRGAATAIGVPLGLFPLATGILLCLAFVTVAVTRRTLLGILCVMPIIPFVALARGNFTEAAFLIALFICVGAKDAWDRSHPLALRSETVGPS
jgi:glycerol-3-phosphate acyltransferase PlsY